MVRYAVALMGGGAELLRLTTCSCQLAPHPPFAPKPAFVLASSGMSNATDKPLLLTTSIAYVNGAPHLGFAMELIAADASTRHARARGREVFFLTGTDEHGAKIEETAKKLGKTPQAMCDENSQKFQDLATALDADISDFIRTTEAHHKQGASQMWEALAAAGTLKKREFTGKYCTGCEAFLPEKDLLGGNCAVHGTPPEEVSEENYFFALSGFSERVKAIIEQHELRIFPHFRSHEILELCKSGLRDVSFSRPTEKVGWGITVPGDAGHSMYVWCDALTNYLSAVGFGQNESWKHYWQQGEVVHFIGKDILRFHAGIWPGMLMAANMPLPRAVVVHGFLTSEGEKMSKSRGNVVDPFVEVEELGGTSDVLRAYLLAEVPMGRDADFTRERVRTWANARLSGGLGNAFRRVCALLEKFGVQEAAPVITDEDLAAAAAQLPKSVDEAMAVFAHHEGMKAVFAAVDALSAFLDRTRPWNAEAAEAQAALAQAWAFLRVLAPQVAIFLPAAGKKLQNAAQSGECGVVFPRLEAEKS